MIVSEVDVCMRFQNWLLTFKSLFLVWGWRQCVFVSAKQPTVTSCSYMALQKVSRVWEYVDRSRLLVFWYKNLVTLWSLFCKISPNDKLFISLGCCFSCAFDVAKSCLVLLDMLFLLAVLNFFGKDTQWCDLDGYYMPTPKVKRTYEWNISLCWI